MKKKELMPYVAPCVQFYNVEIESVLCDPSNRETYSNGGYPDDYEFDGIF